MSNSWEHLSATTLAGVELAASRRADEVLKKAQAGPLGAQHPNRTRDLIAEALRSTWLAGYDFRATEEKS